VTYGLGAAATVIALAAVLSSAGGLDDVLGALGGVSPGWTLAAAAALPVGYALLAMHMRRLAAGGITIWQAAHADLLLFGLGNMLPGAPAPGALLAARQLRGDGLSPRRAGLALMFTMWFNVRTLLGLGALAFLAAFARQHPGVRESGRRTAQRAAPRTPAHDATPTSRGGHAHALRRASISYYSKRAISSAHGSAPRATWVKNDSS
jgi:hypothetical protein